MKNEGRDFNAYYRRRWPNHCKECGGWGEWYSMGSWNDPPDGGPCKCVENGICPRCASARLRYNEPTDEDYCLDCGYRGSVDKGLFSEEVVAFIPPGGG